MTEIKEIDYKKCKDQIHEFIKSRPGKETTTNDIIIKFQIPVTIILKVLSELKEEGEIGQINCV